MRWPGVLSSSIALLLLAAPAYAQAQRPAYPSDVAVSALIVGGNLLTVDRTYALRAGQNQFMFGVLVSADKGLRPNLQLAIEVGLGRGSSGDGGPYDRTIWTALVGPRNRWHVGKQTSAFLEALGGIGRRRLSDTHLSGVVAALGFGVDVASPKSRCELRLAADLLLNSNSVSARGIRYASGFTQQGRLTIGLVVGIGRR